MTLRPRRLIDGRLTDVAAVEEVHRWRREVEGAREDADDHARVEVGVDPPPDDRRICSIAPPPEVFRYEDREELLAVP
jgi:hypothetical protein